MCRIIPRETRNWGHRNERLQQCWIEIDEQGVLVEKKIWAPDQLGLLGPHWKLIRQVPAQVTWSHPPRAGSKYAKSFSSLEGCMGARACLDLMRNWLVSCLLKRFLPMRLTSFLHLLSQQELCQEGRLDDCQWQWTKCGNIRLLEMFLQISSLLCARLRQLNWSIKRWTDARLLIPLALPLESHLQPPQSNRSR